MFSGAAEWSGNLIVGIWNNYVVKKKIHIPGVGVNYYDFITLNTIKLLFYIDARASFVLFVCKIFLSGRFL